MADIRRHTSLARIHQLRSGSGLTSVYAAQDWCSMQPTRHRAFQGNQGPNHPLFPASDQSTWKHT